MYVYFYLKRRWNPESILIQIGHGNNVKKTEIIHSTNLSGGSPQDDV